MGLTKQEQEELSSLRNEDNKLNSMIQRYESELLDSDMMLRNLKRQKKGKWIGFFIFVGLFVAVFAVVVSYYYINARSGTGDTYQHALEFSVSTTVLTFSFMMLGFFLVCCIISGIKTIMELGTSIGAKKLADKFGRTNYPSEIRKYEDLYSLQIKEFNRLKLLKKENTSRIKTLEANETPWYEQ